MGNAKKVRIYSFAEQLEQRLVMAAGGLDASFGTAGSMTAQYFGSSTFAQFLDLDAQSDNKVVGVASLRDSSATPSIYSIGLARFQPDGSADPSFGVGGRVEIQVGSESKPARIAITSGGEIVVAGYSSVVGSRDVLVARFNADGTPDTTFDGDGIKTIVIGTGSEEATGLSVLPDGRIVVVGKTWTSGSGDISYILRLNADGTPDSTFSGTGIFTFQFGTSSSDASDIDVDPLGRYVVTGAGASGTALARIMPSGLLDSTFSGDGILNDNFGLGSGNSAVRPDGRIIVSSASNVATVIQFNADGLRDTTFGTNGVATVPSASTSDSVSDVKLRDDGKVLLTTRSSSVIDPFESYSFKVIQLNANGTPDTSFGTNGSFSYSPYTYADRVVVRADGRIAVAAWNVFGLTSTGQLDTSFGQGGDTTAIFADFASNSTAVVVARQSDGKLLVGGTRLDTATSARRTSIARFNADGSTDYTFGLTGQVINVFTDDTISPTPRINEMLVLPDDKILVIGWGSQKSVVRLNPNGSIDTTYGTLGSWRPSLSGVNANIMTGGTLQNDGKLLLLGGVTVAGQSAVSIIRLNADGTLDSTFNGTGFKQMGTAFSRNHRVDVDSFGRIIYSEHANTVGFRIVRMLSNGQPDSAFNGTGEQIIAGSGFSLGTTGHMAIQQDGKILLGASYGTASPYNTVLYRLDTTGAFDASLTPLSTTSPWAYSDVLHGLRVLQDGSIMLLSANSSADFSVHRFNNDGTRFTNYGTNGRGVLHVTGGQRFSADSVMNPDGSTVIMGTVLSPERFFMGKLLGFTTPIAVAGGPYSVVEGGSIALNGTGSFEPGDSIKAYEWDFNYDGLAFDVDATGATPSFSATNIDGPVTRNIALRVTGSFNQTNIATTSVNVANVAPTAAFAAGAAVTVGSASSVSFSSPNDPSSSDAAAGLKYSYDFNNDGDFTDPGDVLNSTLASASFTYASAGTFNVRGRISDKDGGFTDYTTAAVVNPSTPSGNVTLVSLADAYVRDGSYAGTNFGSALTLDVKKDGSGSYRESYIKFDISSLSGITSAKLRLFGKLSDAVTGGLNVSAYDVADNSWVESTIKFTGRPVSGALAATANVPSKTAQWIEWDLTSYLQARKSAGATQVTLVLKALAGGALINFNSANASTNKPELLVTQGTVVTPQSLIVSTSSLSIAEGGSSSFTVKLATAPASNVIVNIARSGDTDVNAVLSTLTFTPSNWNTAQTVNVNASEDADTTNGSATLTISSSSLSDKTVTVTEIDNDVPPSPDVTLSALDDAFVRDGTNANTNYGSSAVLEVKKDGVSNYRESYLKFDIGSLGAITTAKLRLYGKLSNTVTGGINVSLYDVSSNAWTESTLNFSNKPASGALIGTVNMTSTANGWIEWDLATYLNNAKTAGRTQVTLVLKALAGGALISFSSRNATSNQPQLVVTGGAVTPVQNIIVSTSSLSVNEGSSNSFTVKLGAAPASNVTVNLARTGDSDLSTSLGTLTFTPANWNTPQTITINAAEDVDLTNGTASFTLSSTGLTDKVVSVSEVDNDVPPSSTITLNALQDAHVRDGTNANTNYGANASLEVKKDGVGAYREAYIQFDLTSLTTITSAKLRLFGKLSDPVTSGINVGVHDVTGSWAEGTINYATRPASNATPITTLNLLGTTAKWYEWDLTSYLQAKKAAGATSVSLVLRAQAGGALITFNSKNNAGNQPQLVIN